ncbi:hypothetical protein BaRGS_00021162, partial [Batillaria attramentaria]
MTLLRAKHKSAGITAAGPGAEHISPNREKKKSKRIISTRGAYSRLRHAGDIASS